MEHVKEIVDAVTSRIRSHFFSSVALSFIGFNWQPIFYLFVSKEDVGTRIATVQTDLIYGWPIFVGIGFALAAPWVAWLGNWIARKPVELIKLREVKSESVIETEKNKLQADAAEQRARLVSAEASEARSRAEIATSQTDEAKAKDELDKFHVKKTSENSYSKTPKVAELAKDLTESEQYLLMKLYEDEDGIVTVKRQGGKEVVYMNDFEFGTKDHPVHTFSLSIKNLMQKNLMKNEFSTNQNKVGYHLTPKGAEMAHHLINESNIKALEIGASYHD